MKQKIHKNIITKNKDKVNIEILVLLFKEGKYIVAYCPALELSSYGKTEKEALEYFSDALDIFINDTIKKGTLEKCLLKFGWNLQQIPFVKYIPPGIEDKIKNFNSPKLILEQFAIPI